MTLTPNFLNAFGPCLLTGSLTFPSAEGTLDLNGSTLPGFQAAVETVLNGSRDPFEEFAAIGDWRVEEYADFGYANLVRDDGRFLFLYKSDSRLEVASGVQANGVVYLLGNDCDLKTGRIGTSYQFGFFDEAVGRLRASLRQENATLYALALALSKDIFLSGQYPRESLPNLIRIAHKSSDKAWVICGETEPEALGVLIPEGLTEGLEYLDIRLKKPDLMPLCPRLTDILWELSAVLSSLSGSLALG